MISTLLLSRRRGRPWSAGCCSSRSPTGLVRRARPTRRWPRPPARPPRRSAGCRPPTATTSTPAPSSPSWSSTPGLARRRCRATRSCSPARSPGPAPGVAAGAGTSSTPGVLADSVPSGCAADVERGDAEQTSYTYATIRYAAAHRPAAGARAWSTGSQVTLPADGGTYTLYYLFPMTEQQDTLVAGPPGAGHRRRAAAASWSAALTWLVTRQVVTPGPAGPPGRRAARVRPARGADARARRRRHRPAGHVVQPDGGAACRSRSASSRSCPACSAGSSPTSPTSCARR